MTVAAFAYDYGEQQGRINSCGPGGAGDESFDFLILAENFSRAHNYVGSRVPITRRREMARRAHKLADGQHDEAGREEYEADDVHSVSHSRRTSFSIRASMESNEPVDRSDILSLLWWVDRSTRWAIRVGRGSNPTIVAPTGRAARPILATWVIARVDRQTGISDKGPVSER